MIKHIHLSEEAVMALTIAMATASAIKGVSAANLMEGQINKTIDGINGFMKVCEVLANKAK